MKTLIALLFIVASIPTFGHATKPTREITPDAGPRVPSGADVFFTADFIYWKAVQDSVEYAITGFANNFPANDPFSPTPKGKSDAVGKDWAPGFKGGLGLNIAHDGWDLFVEYTWLHASDSSNISKPDGVALPYFVPIQGGISVIGDRAESDWKLRFNVIDFEIGRNFYLSHFLTMRPFIGLKGTWQDQKWKTRLDGDNFRFSLSNGNTLNVTGPFIKRNRTDVWGLGVRGGFDLGWYMAKNWSIFGDIAFTAMWADYYRLTRKDTVDNVSTGNSKDTVNVANDNVYTIKYVGEMELGLRWETWFDQGNYHVTIQLGWEEQVWINWGLLVEVLDQAEHDLTFHGVNLKFRFDF